MQYSRGDGKLKPVVKPKKCSECIFTTRSYARPGYYYCETKEEFVNGNNKPCNFGRTK